MSPSRLRRTAAVVAAAALLSSCGATDSQTAARVGDEEVSVAQVDRVARAICASSAEQYEQSGQSVPMRRLRQAALNTLTIKAVAEQIADEYGVTPGGAEYGRALAEIEQTAEGLPEELRDDFVDAASVDALLQQVFVAAGESVLAEEGVTDADEQQVIERGVEVVRTWPERYDLEVNPVYDVQVVDGILEPAGGSNAVGVAVSDTARAGANPEPDPSLSAGLPSHLRCG